MASHNAFLIFVLLAAFVPFTTLAKEYIVGDESGWTVNFDYQTWAADKNFQVGDQLVFRYPVGAHNVFKVNGTGFQNCTIPPLDQALTSGDDTIILATPGRKWYICGVGNHCKNGGQKLVITVQPQAPIPAPSMAPSPISGMAYSEMGAKKRPFINFFKW
ncbi:blue copper protein 1a-like [Ricinus communis]|uniref:blue copper protein 1a-like n=1 Tax=Ricinus communis TaxID=3988 RepID=UPI000D68AB89|nr:blue copper protein 1a-like [Ricinus communis]|eukprot:XP_025014312.1 mavicyanin-like [Ricinus communis]